MSDLKSVLLKVILFEIHHPLVFTSSQSASISHLRFTDNHTLANSLAIPKSRTGTDILHLNNSYT